MEKISEELICSELLLFVQSSILDSSVSITPDKRFSDIGIDSMSIIELVLFIERKFEVAISEKDLTAENLKSIQTLAECTFRYL